MEIIRKSRGIIFVLFSFLLISGGCGFKIVPISSQSGTIDLESNIITKEKNGIVISAQTMEWHYEPYYLDEIFTPVLIYIKNGTKDNITLQYNNFALVDSKGELYNVIPPEKVDAFFVSSPRSFYPRRNYFTGFYPPYDFGLDYSYPKQGGVFTVISLLSIPETKILPNTQIRGFLYFKKVPSYGKTLTLRVTLDDTSESFDFEIKR